MMPTRSPPITRKKAAAMQQTRVYDDPPASPSEFAHTDPHADPRFAAAHEHIALEHTATECTATECTATERLLTRTAIEMTAPTAGPSRSQNKPPHGSRAPSVCSRRSTTSTALRIRQAEAEAAIKLADLRRKEIQVEADIIKQNLALEVAMISEENEQQNNYETRVETEERVNNWLHRHRRQEESGDQEQSNAAMMPQLTEKNVLEEQRIPITTPIQATMTRTRPRSPTPQRSRDRGIERLAEALEQMSRNRAPSRQTQDLPLFSGAAQEWLPFKAAMKESTNLHKFTPAENLARLRACLRGEARQAVSGLLSMASDPSMIMRTLEQCFGRPEVIVDQALDEIKRLPRIGLTANELNTFAVRLQNIVTVIRGIDKRGFLCDPMLARHVTDKFPQYLKVRWCDFADQYEDLSEPEIITLSKFLMREADSSMRRLYSSAAHSRAPTHVVPQNARLTEQPRTVNRARNKNVFATTEPPNKRLNECLCCGAEHKTDTCKQLTEMSVSKRWEWAKEAHVCYRCLNSKHRRFLCKSKRCGIDECKQPHHSLLHSKKEERTVESEPQNIEDSAISASTHIPENLKVLLKVCRVTLRGNNNQEINTYALFDEGSTVTLVDEKIASLLGGKGYKRPLNVIGATSSQQEPNSRVVSIAIRGQHQRCYNTIKARTVQNLTLGSQSITPDIIDKQHLKGLRPEDVCYSNAKPQILIGADNWHLIVTRKLLTGKKNQPAASLTRLGWIIHGSTPRSTITKTEQVLHVHTNQEHRENDVLTDLVKAHFDIDALGVTMKRKAKPMEERAKSIFNATVKKRDGHYEVGLPWKEEDVKLPPSYNMALSRLNGIEKKMIKSPEFKEAYSKEVNKLLQKGYATECVTEHTDNSRVWYLPHFAVTNPNKPGKVRMVFDAAARTNDTCLNDFLLDGPDLLQSLQGILFRFRTKPIAVTADIREMFLRVRIRPEDRVAQHFLWRGDNRTDPPRKYEMNSMIFGARSSPFLAHSVRNKNATDNKDSHPLAVVAITQNHYMDDWLQSFENEEIAAQTIREVQEVHKQAGFQLASWSSNRDILLENIEEQDRAHAPKELAANAHLCEKALGILWMPNTDELGFNTAMPRVPREVKEGSRIPTKREALGAVMSLFDPLGLLSPYTITAKIILQELWKKKVGWDEPLPPEEARAFHEWQSDLDYIKDLRLARCYDENTSVTSRELHVFCDASEQAYAAVAYWRITSQEGTSVSLVAGKSKVAPLKAQSIPRMELQASLIGARLAHEIVKTHEWDCKVIFWVDSKTVLHWIHNDAVKYTPFVAHRLSEIAELTHPDQWRWLPTSYNVADDATRAGNTQLKNIDRWFAGPAFLYENENEWPKEITIEPETTEYVMSTGEREKIIDFERFSSYEKTIRAIAYVLLFKDKCKKRATGLTLSHIKEAERIVIKEAQRESFEKEREQLRTQKRVDHSSRLSKLDPILEDGIIRLNGRINASTVPDEMKSPPILDGQHHLTRLLIKKEHNENKHAGREQIVNNLREKWWILRLRPAVRTVIHDCILCKLRRANPVKPIKGDLPQARLSSHSRPFSHCGIDCFGPMWVTIGRRREKRWGMLFTCLVVRAVHIELIASLSTDSAIMAMRRMAARRGTPEMIMSDNGTNFHGADAELKRAYAEWLPHMKEYAFKKRIDWRYIDPGAPNQGGAWERLIKSVKHALAVILQEQAPKEETLLTVMAEIEHTVNSRPLTHVPVEPEDMEALTPNHFLLGTATGLPFVGPCDKADRHSWRAAQALANMFWARWIREYLPTLTPRGDQRREYKNLRVGNIVIIADGTLPRNVWPRGIIERAYEGPDGVVRSADVRTKGGVFRRPVRRLIVLPITEGFDDLRRGETVADNDPSVDK